MELDVRTYVYWLMICARGVKQETLLLQRDRATRLSVEILQLQNIPFESQAYRVALFA